MNQMEEGSAVAGGLVLEKLQQWRFSLQDKLDKFCVLNDEILASVEDDAIEEEIEQSDVFSEQIQQCLCYLEQLILSKPATTNRGSPPHDSSSKSPSESTTTTATTSSTDPSPVPKHDAKDSGSKVKLPKLVPKTFNGDLTKWEAFWSTFEPSIHLNPTLSAVEKNYLFELLVGRPCDESCGWTEALCH